MGGDHHCGFQHKDGKGDHNYHIGDRDGGLNPYFAAEDEDREPNTYFGVRDGDSNKEQYYNMGDKGLNPHCGAGYWHVCKSHIVLINIEMITGSKIITRETEGQIPIIILETGTGDQILIVVLGIGAVTIIETNITTQETKFQIPIVVLGMRI